MTEVLPAHTLLDGRFEILECLQNRAGAPTYKAKDQSSGQSVIIKSLDLSAISDWTVVEQFQAEIALMQVLQHPRIPGFVSAFKQGDIQYLVTAFIPGLSVRKKIESGWKLNEPEAIQLAQDALEILLYLHTLAPPVVHRDIKPANLIMGTDQQLYLIDFGAVWKEEADVEAGSAAGTFGYMPPEQSVNQMTPASDLYALGVTLVELLSGAAPADMPREGLSLNLKSLLQVSPGFLHWLERMVEPELKLRYPTALQALGALGELDDADKALTYGSQLKLVSSGHKRTELRVNPPSDPTMKVSWPVLKQGIIRAASVWGLYVMSAFNLMMFFGFMGLGGTFLWLTSLLGYGFFFGIFAGLAYVLLIYAWAQKALFHPSTVMFMDRKIIFHLQHDQLLVNRPVHIDLEQVASVKFQKNGIVFTRKKQDIKPYKQMIQQFKWHSLPIILPEREQGIFQDALRKHMREVLNNREYQDFLLNNDWT